MLQPRLPFAQVLTAEKINRIFRKHGGLFGEHGIYNTAIVRWAFLGQKNNGVRKTMVSGTEYVLVQPVTV